MDGHLLAEGGHLFRKALARLLPEPRDPLGHHLPGGVTEPRHLLALQLGGQLEGREPRPVENLIGVSVADAAEQARIGEGALDHVVLPGQHPREIGRLRFQHLQAPRVVLGQPRLPPHQMERGPTLAARLGEQQRAGGKIERRQADPAGNLRPRLPPLEPPRDHQVQHQKKFPLQPDHDPLAQPAEAHHPLALGVAEGRIHRPQQERAQQAHLLQRLPLDARPQVFQVKRDVGQFRHEVGFSESSPLFWEFFAGKEMRGSQHFRPPAPPVYVSTSAKPMPKHRGVSQGPIYD